MKALQLALAGTGPAAPGVCQAQPLYLSLDVDCNVVPNAGRSGWSVIWCRSASQAACGTVSWLLCQVWQTPGGSLSRPEQRRLERDGEKWLLSSFSLLVSCVGFLVRVRFLVCVGFLVYFFLLVSVSFSVCFFAVFVVVG